MIMSDDPFSKLELALEPSETIEIGSTGSIASGKSTFLSALHGVLGYHNAGIRIEKERLLGSRAKVKSQAYERLKRGLLRTNATDFPDFLQVYGAVNGNVYPFEFYAPGGHFNAVSLDITPSALLFFLDLNFAARLKEFENYKGFCLGGKASGERHGVYIRTDISTIKTEWVNGELVDRNEPNANIRRALFGWVEDAKRLNNWGRDFSIEEMAESWGFSGVKNERDFVDKLESVLDDIPQFGLPPKEGPAEYFEKKGEVYKGEIVGAVIQSLIDSYLYAGSLTVPVIGVGTHKNSVYGKLPNELGELLTAVRGILNKYGMKFKEYLDENGLEGKVTDFDLTDGIAPLMEWFFTDLIGTKIRRGKHFGKWTEYRLNIHNMNVIQIAHNITAKAMQYRGIDSNGLRLITFSKRQSELTVPYSSVK